MRRASTRGSAPVRRRLGNGGVEQAGAVQMARESEALCQGGGLLDIRHRQQLAAQCVFQRQQAAAGEVRIVWFHGRFDIRQRQRSVALVFQRLWLHAAEHGRSTALPAIAMLHLPDDVLVAALAMRQHRAQVALRAGGHEQSRLEAEHSGDLLLQRVDARIVTEHVVAQRRLGHRRAHRGSRPGHRVAAQIHHVLGHVRSRKLRSMACPCSVRIDSGWNCTPSMASSRCRTPMISPSSVQAVVTRSAGHDARSMASEW